MKENERTAIIGSKVQLVPYEKQHVLKYHNWMQNPFLLETTASEPLSLQEEYDMQQSWRDDKDKCTFIVCDFEKLNDCQNKPIQFSSSSVVKNDEMGLGQDATVVSMIGDVNLFVEDEPNRGQILIMIAEGIAPNDINNNNNGINTHTNTNTNTSTKSYQRSGYGTEAVKLMIIYAYKQLQMHEFIVKISQDNHASINMFTKKLSFVHLYDTDVFKESTFILTKEKVKELADDYAYTIQNDFDF